MKLFFSTLALVFLAELGDKTQLTALALAAKEQRPVLVFFAAMGAFALSTLLAVGVGAALAKVLPAEIIKKIAAVGFLIAGGLLFFNKL